MRLSIIEVETLGGAERGRPKTESTEALLAVGCKAFNIMLSCFYIFNY
jgi:hypothetical protein